MCILRKENERLGSKKRKGERHEGKENAQKNLHVMRKFDAYEFRIHFLEFKWQSGMRKGALTQSKYYNMEKRKKILRIDDKEEVRRAEPEEKVKV